MRWQTLRDTAGWQSVGRGEGLAPRGALRRLADAGVWLLVLASFALIGLPLLAWYTLAAAGTRLCRAQKPGRAVDASPDDD